MEEEINLYDYWLIIKKNRWIIISLFLILVLGTMIISFLIPKTYKATASILPSVETGKGIGLETLLGSVGIKGITQQATSTDVFLAILKSRTMADEIINKFNLQEVYKCETKQDTRKVLKGMTQIKVSKDKTITVSVIDRDPKRAADIANFYIITLDHLNRKLNITAASQKRKFIEKRLKETEKALRDAEEKLKLYQIKHKVVAGNKDTVAAEAAGELEGRLIAKRVELEAKKKYATSKNPDIIKLEDEVKELEKALIKLPPVGTELARLIREVKVQETVYELLVSQYEQAKIEEARDTPTVQVLDWATVPEKKYKPKIKLNISIAGVLGIFLGLFLSFLKEFYEKNKGENGEKQRLDRTG